MWFAGKILIQASKDGPRRYPYTPPVDGRFKHFNKRSWWTLPRETASLSIQPRIRLSELSLLLQAWTTFFYKA